MWRLQDSCWRIFPNWRLLMMNLQYYRKTLMNNLTKNVLEWCVHWHECTSYEFCQSHLISALHPWLIHAPLTTFPCNYNKEVWEWTQKCMYYLTNLGTHINFFDITNLVLWWRWLFDNMYLTFLNDGPISNFTEKVIMLFINL